MNLIVWVDGVCFPEGNISRALWLGAGDPPGSESTARTKGSPGTWEAPGISILTATVNRGAGQKCPWPAKSRARTKWERKPLTR